MDIVPAGIVEAMLMPVQCHIGALVQVVHSLTLGSVTSIPQETHAVNP